MIRTRTPLLALALFLSLASCATGPQASTKAAAPPSAGDAQAPAATAAPSAAPNAPADAPSDIQGELYALAQAESAIDAAFPGLAKDDKDRARREVEMRSPRKGEPRVNVGEQPMNSGGACAIACKALASMTRSADHLCSLAGDGDARCTEAHARVKSATDRVRSACPSCTP